MACKQGDSIRAGKIDSYNALIGRSEGTVPKPYELTLDDASNLYQEIVSNLHSKGYQGEIKPFRTVVHDSSNDLLSLLIRRKQDCDYVHPDTQVARIGAMMQNLLVVNSGDMAYLNYLQKRVRSNISKLSKAYLKPYYSGYCLQSIKVMSSNPEYELAILNSSLDFLNSNLESCSVQAVRYSNEPVKPSDCNIMIGTLERDRFKDLLDRYSAWWNSSNDKLPVKEQDIRASIHLMLKDSTLNKSGLDIKIAQKKDKWVMALCVPVTVSPYLILKELYPKIKLNEIYHACNFMVYDVVRKLDKQKDVSRASKLCSCGNECVYSLVSERASRLCPSCLMKVLLSKFVLQ